MIQRSLRSVLAAAFIAAVLIVSAGVYAEAPVGDYRYTQERNEQTFTTTISIGKDAEGKLIGKWVTERGESALKDLKWDAEKMTLSFTRVSQGQDGTERTSSFAGKVEGGKLVGTITTQRGDRELTAALVDPAEKLIGQWEITQTFNDQQRTSTVTFAAGADGKVAGKWASQRGESALENLKVEGDVVTFNRTISFQDNTFTMGYKGKIAGDKITGVFTSDRGENEGVFTKKAPAPAPAAAAPATTN